MTPGHDDSDLRALRRMLPVPAERDFPPGRRHQREEHLMSSWLQMARQDSKKTSSRLPSPAPSRRGLALVGTAAAVGALALGVTVLLPGTSSTPALAATPELLTYVQDAPAQDAAKLLERLADTAARQPDTTVSGTEHFKNRGWYLNTSVGERTVSAVVPTESELWVNPDGSVHSTRRAGAPEFPSKEARTYWKEQGGWPTGPSKPEVNDVPAGSWAREGRPPTDAKALKTWLKQGHPEENGPAVTLMAITDLLHERVLSAPERAAVLRVLADVPGITYQGTTTDRAGRTGKAFSLDSDHGGLPTRQTLIVDPASGRILDDEEVLTKSAGKLGVPVPSVISYTVYLAADTQPAPTRAGRPRLRPSQVPSSVGTHEPGMHRDGRSPRPAVVR
ncbi:CU044_5270 family protein [Streptomyces sp. SKN60]|uniref:CU044_5270 family protein n=1 Tax=Streptomyces sp. SKN60 TaxID=2855506 RepID=UPI002246A0DE|nr:CU044_5270 family protein [Streptomyces sp. SKN60]MCX2185004.1 CU044_5270 family protein [Streptomyces sp. SKN60]